MATDGIRKEPVVVEGPDGDDTIAIHHVGMLALAWDHRAFDGAYAASFLNEVRERARDPRLGRRARVTRRQPTRARCAPGGSGSVPYREAEALQRAIHERSDADYLLLQEHPHVYTLGSSADPAHVLRDPASVGAELVDGRPGRRRHLSRSRPARRLPDRLARRVAGRPARRRRVRAQARGGADRGARRLRHRGDVRAEVHRACGSATRRSRRSACASRAAGPGTASRSTSIPTSRCSSTSCRAASATAVSRRWRGCSARAPEMREVVDRVVARFAEAFGAAEVDRQDVAWRVSPDDLAPFTRGAAARRARCGCSAGWPRRVSSRTVDPAARRPEWMKVRARFDDEYLELKRLVRDLDLHTVCEEAGCPNIYECWADRTATFMILGDRCTRACGFCLVDTRKPLAVDARRAAPRRRRGARARPRARRDHVRRPRRPSRRWRVGLRGDGRRGARREPGDGGRAADLRLKGDDASLAAIFAARPDVLNHNLETVARLQRAARPSAGYARSLSVLGAREGRRSRHEVGPDPRHGRDGRRGARRARPTCGRSASTS